MSRPVRLAAALALLLLPLLAGCQRLLFAAVNLRGEAEVRQASYGDAENQALDVYAPQGTRAPQGAPIVVFFYGGRWQGGRRADYAFVGKALARHGIVAVLPDYRHYPQVRFPAFVEDAARAVAWTRAHAAELGGDPRRVFLAGHSSGAHLAALLATDARYLDAVGLRPRDLRGVAGIAGPYDFLPLTDPALQAIFAPESRWPESQPVTFVDGDEPPFLLLHGADDEVVWPRNSARLAARLRAAGVPVADRVYADLGHVRILLALRYPRLAPTLRDLVEFVHEEEAAPESATAR
jgi:acetyl esterase/lipase